MKKNQFILFLLLIILFSSCYSTKISYNNLENIQRGMHPKEVMAILGEPSYRSFNQKGEVLEFRSSEYGTAKVVRVWFFDHSVVKMESYLESESNCHNRKESFSDKNKNKDRDKEEDSDKDKSSEEETSSGIRVTTDGEHIIKMGSIIVTSDGRHETVVSDTGGLIITASGEHIHTF